MLIYGLSMVCAVSEANLCDPLSSLLSSLYPVFYPVFYPVLYPFLDGTEREAQAETL